MMMKHSIFLGLASLSSALVLIGHVLCAPVQENNSAQQARGQTAKCKGSGTSAQFDLEPVQQITKSLNIIVDPRVELLSVVQHISQYREKFPMLLNKEAFAYKEQVDERFSEYKDHRVVKMFNDVSSRPRMFNFGAPPTVMLYLTGCFELREDVVVDDFNIQRIGGMENLRKFGRYLREFGEESGFAHFFAANRGYYEKLIENVISKIGTKNFIEEIETFYGTKQRSYNLILVSLYGPVGFGPLLETRNGKTHIYSIMGPHGQKGGTPIFGSEEYFKNMVRHEFSHSFVNPLTEKHREKIAKYSSLFEAIPENAKRRVCGEWEECLNEHIVRAVTTQLAFLESEEAGRRALEYEKSMGLIFIEDLLERIKEYEQNRESYPSFATFYERLLETFDKRVHVQHKEEKMADYMKVVEVMSAFLTPLLGIITAVILISRHKLQRRRWRLDLYDKRYPVYTSTMHYISCVTRSRNVTNEELVGFLRSSKDKEFLFGKDVQEFLEKLYERGNDLNTIVSTVQGEPVGENRSKLIEKESQLCKWFGQQFVVSKTLFAKYLRMDKK